MKNYELFLVCNDKISVVSILLLKRKICFKILAALSECCNEFDLLSWLLDATASSTSNRFTNVKKIES